MKKLFFITFLVLGTTTVVAWNGDTDKFTFSADTINLSAPAESGEAVLYDTCSACYNAVWNATFLFDYTPSSSNFCKWFIMADSPSLGSELNGYYIRVGYSGKNISLCHQSGSKSETLSQGEEGRVVSGIPINITVSRSETGAWRVLSIAENEADSTLEAEAVDAAVQSNRYSGFWFKYSSTRSSAFHTCHYWHRGKRIDYSGHDAGSVWIEPLTFTPDGDSSGDLAYIYYKLNEHAVANIYIFNANGVLVRHLVNNTQLLEQGVVTWDGLSDRNLLMPSGIYVVLFESFTEEKVTLRKKLPFVLGVK